MEAALPRPRGASHTGPRDAGCAGAPEASLPHMEAASRAQPAERLSFQQISPDDGQATSMSCEHSGRTAADRRRVPGNLARMSFSRLHGKTPLLVA